MEIDRLGDKIECAPVHRYPDVLHIPVSGDNHRLEDAVEPGELAKQRQPVHHRHIDIAQDDIDGWVLIQDLQRLLAITSEHQLKGPFPHLTTKFLAHQDFQIGLVIDHQDLHRRCVRHVPRASRCKTSRRKRSKSIGLVT